MNIYDSKSRSFYSHAKTHQNTSVHILTFSIHGVELEEASD